MFLLLIKDNLEHLKNLGVEEGNIGTHSYRKVVVTMVSSGCNVSTPIVLICIRSGCAMGGLKDKSLKRKYAGNQYVERCASVLDHIEKIILLHPHTFIYLEFRTKSKRSKQKKESNPGWMPGYDRRIV